MAAAVRFVVSARSSGQWSEVGEREDENRAVSFAREQGMRDGCDGAKVERLFLGGDGRELARIVYLNDKAANPGPERLALNKLSAVPPCAAADDLFAWPARRTIWRLFRRTFERDAITPSELLHLYDPLGRLLSNREGIAGAVLKAANLQTSGRAAETPGRREQLYDFADDLARRAYAAQSIDLPPLKAASVVKFRAAAAAGARDGVAADYLERVGIARELGHVSNLWGKFGLALDLFDQAGREGTALSGLDGFVADLLMHANLIDDMVGSRDAVIDQVNALMDLAEGRPPAALPTKPSTQLLAANAGRLAAHFVAGDLPDGVQALHEHVLDVVAQAPFLTANGAGDEETAGRNLLRRVVVPEQPLPGGPDMAEALMGHILRLCKLNEDQADRGLRVLQHWLAEPMRIARFMLALASTKYAKAIGDPLDEFVVRALDNAGSLAKVFPNPGGPLWPLRAAASLQREVAGAASLGIVTRKALSGRIDDLLVVHFDEMRPIDAILGRGGPYHLKALALIALCVPDYLPEGKTLERARKAVVEQLRNTGYERTIAAEIKDPAARELAHRDMLAMMRQARFI